MERSSLLKSNSASMLLDSLLHLALVIMSDAVGQFAFVFDE